MKNLYKKKILKYVKKEKIVYKLQIFMCPQRFTLLWGKCSPPPTSLRLLLCLIITVVLVVAVSCFLFIFSFIITPHPASALSPIQILLQFDQVKKYCIYEYKRNMRVCEFVSAPGHM